MNTTTCRWEKGHRYYEAQVTEDLYGWVFVRTWGKKGARLIDSPVYSILALRLLEHVLIIRSFIFIKTASINVPTTGTGTLYSAL